MIFLRVEFSETENRFGFNSTLKQNLFIVCVLPISYRVETTMVDASNQLYIYCQVFGNIGDLEQLRASKNYNFLGY